MSGSTSYFVTSSSMKRYTISAVVNSRAWIEPIRKKRGLSVSGLRAQSPGRFRVMQMACRSVPSAAFCCRFHDTP